MALLWPLVARWESELSTPGEHGVCVSRVEQHQMLTGGEIQAGFFPCFFCHCFLILRLYLIIIEQWNLVLFIYIMIYIENYLLIVYLSTNSPPPPKTATQVQWSCWHRDRLCTVCQHPRVRVRVRVCVDTNGSSALVLTTAFHFATWTEDDSGIHAPGDGYLDYLQLVVSTSRKTPW